MILSRSQSKKILDQVRAASKADSWVATVSGTDRRHVRFALNSVTTSGEQDDVTLSVTSHFGKRSGTAATNELDSKSIVAAVAKSEQIARLAPENAEFMPPLGPQKYVDGKAFNDATAKAAPEKLATLSQPVLKEANNKNVIAAGFFQVAADSSAYATSNDLLVQDQTTHSLFTVTARSPDGTGSGWAGKNSHDLRKLDTATMGERAVEKGRKSVKPTALDPGKYTVILEHSAVCDLVGWMIGDFDARSADEGRSFLSKPGGGNKLGSKLVSDKVNIFSDPEHSVVPGAIYSNDGLPAKKRQWIKDGVVQELMYSRFWAKKQNREPFPFPTNLVMEGGKTSIDDMIRDTRRGVLVTRFWYIREVDPQTLLLTGLTRDGTFLIENGKISRPIKNFRFNESPVNMLNNVIAMTPSERAAGSEIEGWPISVPALLVKDFTFSSLSDAV
jgi:predicted Zn-dependent protease